MKCRTKTVDLRLNLYGFLKERRSSSSVKISFKFTDKVLFFDDLSVSKTAFYGQTGHFQRFVRKFLTIMMRIYGQTRLFGAFVRKTGSETAEFLRTNGHF